MKDIPIFDTENGVASLFLKEIPYQGEAHIRILSSQNPELLMEECLAFCRACGAVKVDAAGHPFLEKYPLVTTIIEMSRSIEDIPVSSACLFPVTDGTISYWRKIYNDKMKSVPNASYMTLMDEKKQLDRGDGYFIHRDGNLLGIGRAAGDTIEVVASVIPGAGRDIVLSLISAITDDRVRLVVSDTNVKAMRLYKSLGFVCCKVLSKWYKIL